MEKYRLGLFHTAAWAGRLLILAAVIATPWFYGGVQWQFQYYLAWGGLLIASLAALALASSPRRMGHGTPLSLWMLVMMLGAAAQTIPLPASVSWFTRSERFVAEVTQAAQLAAEQGETSAAAALANAGSTAAVKETATPTAPFEESPGGTISIHAERSRAALGALATATAVLWASSLLFTPRRWAIALAACIAISGGANGFLGLLQRLTWNNWTLLTMPKTNNYFSTFVSRNSAAAYFPIVIGALLVILGQAYRVQKKKRRQEYRLTYPGTSIAASIRNRMEDIFVDLNSLAVACICCLAFLAVATLATFSRGGALATIGAALATLFITLGARGNIYRALMTAGAITVAVVGMMTFFEFNDPLLNRFDSLNDTTHGFDDGRLAVWSYTLTALRSHGLLGSGLCTFQFALLPFQTGLPSFWFQHAENLYLELWSDLGVLGIIACIGLVVTLGRELIQESVHDREALLFVGVTFAVIALLLHSFVDFGLILPGVFLPLCAMVGAFSGRARRAEAEHAHRKQPGERAAQDARVAYKQGEPVATKPRRSLAGSALHGAIGVACAAVILLSMFDLRAFAIAERLGNQLDDIKLQVQTEDDDAAVATLGNELEQALQMYADHPEVRLLAGSFELFSWQYHALTTWDWSPTTKRPERWQTTEPLMMRVIALAEQPTTPLRLAIEQDTAGIEMCQRSRQHFEFALNYCPMDYRAVLGVFVTSLGELPTGQDQWMTTALQKLHRFNPQLLATVGMADLTIGAVVEGRIAAGKQLIQQAIDIDPARLPSVLESLVLYLPNEEIIPMLPQDTVQLAFTARTVSAYEEKGQALAKLLISQIAGDLAEVQSTTVEGWKVLAWVAKQSNDQDLHVKFLKKMLFFGSDSPPVRLELVDALFESGQLAEAQKELDHLLRSDPSNEEIKKRRKNWQKSVDQAQ